MHKISAIQVSLQEFVLPFYISCTVLYTYQDECQINFFSFKFCQTCQTRGNGRKMCSYCWNQTAPFTQCQHTRGRPNKLLCSSKHLFAIKLWDMDFWWHIIRSLQVCGVRMPFLNVYSATEPPNSTSLECLWKYLMCIFPSGTFNMCIH